MSIPQFDRLGLKKEILESSRKGKIPLLSYIHFEVIDPRGIDSSLVEYLDTGILEGGLTDDLFFECLQESPDYLAYAPFRQRLREWQEILYDSLTTKEARSKAKRHLQRVGKVLSQERRGRPAEHDDLVFQVRDEFNVLAEHLSPYLQESRGLRPGKRKKLFIERFPFWKDYADLALKHRGMKELAKAIICRRHGISRRALHNLLNYFSPKPDLNK